MASLPINNDIGKWSVKKINYVNVKKILMFERYTTFESRHRFELARVLEFLDNRINFSGSFQVLNFWFFCFKTKEH